MTLIGWIVWGGVAWVFGVVVGLFVAVRYYEALIDRKGPQILRGGGS